MGYSLEGLWDLTEEGLSVQMLHKGSYDNEPETFANIKEFMKYFTLKKVKSYKDAVKFIVG